VTAGMQGGVMGVAGEEGCPKSVTVWSASERLPSTVHKRTQTRENNTL
jgi:ABC-type dipeptide/oligopeptide/nickel transport system ATPase component